MSCCRPHSSVDARRLGSGGGKPSAVKGHTRHEGPRLVPSEGEGRMFRVGNEPEGSENARVVNDVGYADIVDFLVSHEGGTGVTSHFPGKEDGWQRLVLRSIIWSCQNPIRYIGMYVLTYVQSYT